MRRTCEVIAVVLAAVLASGWTLPHAAFAKMDTAAAEEEDPLTIQMDITDIDKNSDSFSVGEPHTWIIRSEIPKGIGADCQYAITQTLDHRLSYIQGSLSAALLTEDKEKLPLEMETHYTLTSGTVMEGGYPADRICLSLTPAGITYLSEFLKDEKMAPELRIRFQTSINEEADMGTQIVSAAQLNYTDAEGTYTQAVSDKASVCTGGFHVLLTDKKNTPCAGGRFMIARPATEEEIADRGVTKELLDIGSDTIAVIYETFYGSEDLRRKTDLVTTGEAGKAVFYGLAYGSYYLVQIKAPDGKEPIALPIAVEINEVSHITEEDGWKDGSGNAADNTVRVINTDSLMPETGGMGTTVFTVSGAGLLLCAGFLLFANRKKVRHI